MFVLCRLMWIPLTSVSDGGRARPCRISLEQEKEWNGP